MKTLISTLSIFFVLTTNLKSQNYYVTDNYRQNRVAESLNTAKWQLYSGTFIGVPCAFILTHLGKDNLSYGRVVYSTFTAVGTGLLLCAGYNATKALLIKTRVINPKSPVVFYE